MGTDEGRVREAAEDARLAWERYRTARRLTGGEIPELDLAVRMGLLAHALDGTEPEGLKLVGGQEPETTEIAAIRPLPPVEGSAGNRVTPQAADERPGASEGDEPETIGYGDWRPEDIARMVREREEPIPVGRWEREDELRAWAQEHGGTYIRFPEVERIGALVIETRGPWGPDERPALAEIRGVTDWGPWAQHNFPCPVCKERLARVELGGWIFGPCAECRIEGWVLELQRPSWWRRLTRR